MLNTEVSRQAAMIGYISDFKLMMWITLLSMPLLLLMRKPQARVVAAAEATDTAH